MWALGRARPLTDAGAVAMAGATALGAWWSPALPWWVAVVALLVAVSIRRPPVVVLTAAVLAAFLGGRAWQGDRPVAPGPFRGTATLVGDPQEVAGAVVAEVRAGDHHLVVWARGPAGAVLDRRLAGQSVVIAGRRRPRPPGDVIEASRHVVGELEATSIRAAGDGGPAARLANLVHSRLEAGADALPRDRRSVYRGFVLGDDRGESAVIASDFAASGLAHLLVVSGENVAFVVAAAATESWNPATPTSNGSASSTQVTARASTRTPDAGRPSVQAVTAIMAIAVARSTDGSKRVTAANNTRIAMVPVQSVPM